MTAVRHETQVVSAETPSASSDVPFVIRPYRAGDETAILETFNRVFPWAGRTPAEWRWQFVENPEALRCFIATTPDGRIAAQFTGIPRRVKVGGVERSFSEIVDSFADPACRAGLKKPGVFARTALAYIEHYCRPESEAFAYGLPNPDAFRIGGRLLGYSSLHHVALLARPTDDGSGRDGAGVELNCRIVEEIAAFTDDTDDLWRRASAALPVSVVRDRRYLAWRYARPGATYRRFAVRDGHGDLAALIVLRDRWLAEDFGPDVTVVADWVVDRAHPASRGLFALLPRLAAEAGASRVACVFPPASIEAREAVRSGFRAEPTKFRLVGRSYEPARLSLDDATGTWFWTLGDFDIV